MRILAIVGALILAGGLVLACSKTGDDPAAAATDAPAAAPSTELAGYWVGMGRADDGAKVGLSVELIPSSDGRAFDVSVNLASRKGGALTARDVSAEGASIAFSVDLEDRVLLFRGGLTQQDKVLSGSIDFEDDRRNARLPRDFRLERRRDDPTDVRGQRRYEGTIGLPDGRTVPFGMTIGPDSAGSLLGTVDLPALGVKASPLTEVVRDGSRFEAVWHGNVRVALELKFDSTYRGLRGMAHRPGSSGPIQLELVPAQN